MNGVTCVVMQGAGDDHVFTCAEFLRHPLAKKEENARNPDDLQR